MYCEFSGVLVPSPPISARTRQPVIIEPVNGTPGNVLGHPLHLVVESPAIPAGEAGQDNEVLRCAGTVATKYPQVENGIDFIDMAPDDRLKLNQYITEQNK